VVFTNARVSALHPHRAPWVLIGREGQAWDLLSECPFTCAWGWACAWAESTWAQSAEVSGPGVDLTAF
jgi:hypothetical protein